MEKEYTSYVKRKKLIDQLPLDTPLGIHICPSTYCNFKCSYCKHSLDTVDRMEDNMAGWVKREFMDMELYKKIIEQLKLFPNKIKLLNFAWLGEPLLNPNISKMIEIAKKEQVAETVSIVTNGACLSPKLSNELINAGLDRLRISIQGMHESDYWEISKYKINYNEYIENIKYFFENKIDTSLYIKIMDVMLKTQKDEIKFKETFGPICDNLNIEHLVPLHNEISVSGMKENYDIGYFGNLVKEYKMCSYPFFLLIITPSGEVLPCPSADSYINSENELCNMSLGNVKDLTITDIWNGQKMKQLRETMILGKKKDKNICKDCPYVKYHTATEDVLDGFEDSLKNIYLQ